MATDDNSSNAALQLFRCRLYVSFEAGEREKQSIDAFHVVSIHRGTTRMAWTTKNCIAIWIAICILHRILPAIYFYRTPREERISWRFLLCRVYTNTHRTHYLRKRGGKHTMRFTWSCALSFVDSDLKAWTVDIKIDVEKHTPMWQKLKVKFHLFNSIIRPMSLGWLVAGVLADKIKRLQ